MEATGTRVVAISYDSVAVLKRFSEAQKISFPLLSDADSKVIDAYLLRNRGVKAGSKQDGVPNPATVLIDRSGKVRAVIGGTIVRRHSTETLLQAIAKMKQADSR